MCEEVTGREGGREGVRWTHVTPPIPADPHNLGIRCRLNGKTVQDSNTNQLVHKTEDLVAWISQ